MLTLTKDYLKYHMERILTLWYANWPDEAARFERECEAEQWEDEGRTKKQQLRSKGSIPIRIWTHFLRLDPAFWDDKSHRKLFWDMYPKAHTAAKRRGTGGFNGSSTLCD